MSARGRAAGGIRGAIHPPIARIPLAIGLAVTLAGLLLAAPAARAGTIVVDGLATDWRGALPPSVNVGRIARDTAQGVEYVWLDRSSDEHPTPGANAARDLVQFRVTADPFRLYFFGTFRAAPPVSGAGAPLVQIAIDFDRVNDSGRRDLGYRAETRVGQGAAWEYLLASSFATGAAPRLCDSALSPVSSPTQGALSASGVFELSVPWGSLGYSIPPADPARFTVAIFRATASDSALDIGGPSVSNAIDAVTDGGLPGDSAVTATEVADGVIDGCFDVWFDFRGEPYSPLIVSEFSWDGGTKSDWIEVYNASRSTLSLPEFKVGDNGIPLENEGMAAFPAGTTLAPGRTFVVARDGSKFFDLFGYRAHAEAATSDPATPDMAPCLEWSDKIGFSLAAGGDDILVLDGRNTVVDVVVYGTGSWPGVTSVTAPVTGTSYVRAPIYRDTDNCAVDFANNPSPTPGQTPPAVTGVGEGGGAGSLHLAPPAPNPFRGATAVRFRLQEPEVVTVQVLDLAGRIVRTLDADTRYPAGSHSLRWDGGDAGGRAVESGVYFVRVRAGGAERVTKAVRIE